MKKLFVVLLFPSVTLREVKVQVLLTLTFELKSQILRYAYYGSYRFLSLLCLGPSTGSYRGHRAIGTIAVSIVTSAVTTY